LREVENAIEDQAQHDHDEARYTTRKSLKDSWSVQNK
jgi:hypothetical protein